MLEAASVRRVWLPAAILLGLVLLLLGRCGNTNGTKIVGSVTGETAPAAAALVGSQPSATTPKPTPTTPKPSATTPKPSATTAKPTSTPKPSGTSAGYPAPGSPGTVVATGGVILPLPAGVGGDLSSFSGQLATGTSVPVQSVVADEGFWIGSSDQDRIYVQLTGPPPESPYQVRAGDSVTFQAKVTPNPADFAASLGVTVAEGAQQLTAQGQHLAVAQQALKTSAH
jgi:hypothetical protein